MKSPGVPQDAPVVRAARERGLLVLGELELGWRLLPNDVIAITGSNGKTTTTELVGQIHREAGLPVAVAGNVGTALSSLAGKLDPAAVVVCEASSFQLEDTIAFAPEAAVLLNLTPDHLDRHGTFDAYRDAKLRIFANQDRDALAVVPAGLDHGGPARRVVFASPLAADGGAARRPTSSSATASSSGAASRSSRSTEIRLRGTHNLENAMAAAAVTLARGVEPAAVRAALAGFAGVAHRLEEVARVDGVLYVDDSKATNVASAVVGIRSFPGGVHAILGGRGKQEDYAPLAAAVAERCAAAYLIGEEAARLARRARAGRRAAARLRRPRARGGRRARGRGAGRGRAALARLRLLRPVPLVRGARRALQGARSAGDRHGRPCAGGVRTGAVESRSDGQVQAAAARAPTAPHGHLLPARRRRGDGLLGLLGAHAARGPRRRDGVPREVPDVRRGRARRDAPALAPRARARAPLHAACCCSARSCCWCSCCCPASA